VSKLQQSNLTEITGKSKKKIAREIEAKFGLSQWSLFMVVQPWGRLSVKRRIGVGVPFFSFFF